MHGVTIQDQKDRTFGPIHEPAHELTHLLARHSLGLFENGGITNAALVLFGVNPTRWLPQARVRLLVLPKGKAGDRHAVDRLFERNLLRVRNKVTALIRRKWKCS